MNEIFTVMVEGKQTPSRIYVNYDEAEKEAARLATQERKTTYVLKVIAVVELNDVKITKL